MLFNVVRDRRKAGGAGQECQNEGKGIRVDSFARMNMDLIDASHPLGRNPRSRDILASYFGAIIRHVSHIAPSLESQAA